MSGFVGTTVFTGFPSNSTQSVALPAGSVAGGYCFIFATSSGSAAASIAASGFLQLVSTAYNNAYLYGICKQLTSADIAAGSISVTLSGSQLDVWLATFDETLTGFDSGVSLPLGSSAYGTRGGVSQSATAIPGVTAVTATQGILFAFERTTATGTTVTALTYGTQDYFFEQTANSANSFLIGHCSLTPGTASGTDTVTYSGGSGNAIGFIVAMTGVTTSASAPQPVRPRLVLPVWRHAAVARFPPLTVVVASLPLQSSRRRSALLPRRRATTSRPVPAAVVAVSVTVPPQPPHRRSVLPRLRRASETQPPTSAPALVLVVPPPQPMRRRTPWPRRRASVAQMPPTVTVILTAQLVPALGVRSRVDRRARVRGRSAQPLPPAIVVPAEALPPQPARPRRWVPRRFRRLTASPFWVVVIFPNGSITPDPSTSAATITPQATGSATATPATCSGAAMTPTSPGSAVAAQSTPTGPTMRGT